MLDDLPLGWMLSSPDVANIEIDREIVRRFGYRGFLKIAWPIVEGGKPFVGGWHIDCLAEHLEATLSGEIRRLGINIPPRMSKSTLTSVMLCAYDWIKNPWRQYFYASYAHNLSLRDSRKCRLIIESPWFQARWGDRFQIVSDQNTKIRYDNDRGGYRFSTSFEGQVTGDGGDIVVLDDPNNVRQSESDIQREAINTIWDDSLQTRLNDPKKGAFIVNQQRTHARDLSGHIQTIERDGWVWVVLPMRYEPDHPLVYARDPRKIPGELLCPDRYGEEEVQKLERNPYLAAGQLQQRPAPRKGGMFQHEWFPIVDAAPAGLRICRGWDFAATEVGINPDPDWTASAKLGIDRDGIIYVLDVGRFRGSDLAVENGLKNTADQDGRIVEVSIPQDPGQAGKAQAARFVRKLAGFRVRATVESGDKVVRAGGLSAQSEAGNVRLVRGAWNKEFLDELTMFPNAAHDDQVDAASRAFNHLCDPGKTGLLEAYRQEIEEMERQKAEQQKTQQDQQDEDPT